MATTSVDNELIRAMGDKLKEIQTLITHTQNKLNDLAEQERYHQSVLENMKRVERGLLETLQALGVDTLPANPPTPIKEHRA